MQALSIRNGNHVRRNYRSVCGDMTEDFVSFIAFDSLTSNSSCRC